MKNNNKPNWSIKQNPYNFVPFENRLNEKNKTHSFSSFQNMNGSIVCTLTNKTPLLIAQLIDAGPPKKLQFFQESGKYIIPGSSLKGMLRSVLEAVTNSCFSVFNEDRLDYRHTSIAEHLQAGRILSMPSVGKSGEIQLMERGWIAMQGKSIQVNGCLEGKQQTTTIELAVVPSGIKSGGEIWCKIEIIDSYITSKQRKIDRKFYLITDISDSEKTGYTKGIYKITGQSIGHKKRERIFFTHTPDKKYTFSQKEVDDYNYILDQQKARWNKPDPSSGKKFDLKEQGELREGSIVYFEPLEGNSAGHISRVEIPRIRYLKSRKDLLPEEYHKCSDPENLCATCNLFGFVEDKKALAGRINFSDANLNGDPKVASEFIPLKVLGTPHPTSYNFYLIDHENAEKVWNYDGSAIINNKGEIRESDDGKALLRGRKFYYHHPNSNDLSYYKVESGVPATQYNEVKPLLKDNTFTFEIRFTNLSQFELGLLLYCIVLEDKLQHKLGMGKPIGFGTVSIDIKSLLVEEEPFRKYEDFFYTPTDKKEEIPEYINDFKKNVKSLTGKGFNSLHNIKALQILLNTSNVSNNLGYPSPEGYKWYMQNRNTPLPELIPANRNNPVRNKPSMLTTFGNLVAKNPVASITKKEDTVKTGSRVKGKVIEIHGLNGIAKLKTGEEVHFKKPNQYTHIEVDQNATFLVDKITDGKITHMIFKK